MVSPLSPTPAFLLGALSASAALTSLPFPVEPASRDPGEQQEAQGQTCAHGLALSPTSGRQDLQQVLGMGQ